MNFVGGPVADSVLIDYLSVEGTTQNTPRNCEGITIHGDGNVIMRSEVKNGGPGVGVCALGDNNLVSFVTSRGSSFGIAVFSGNGSVIEHCDASGNSELGFSLSGNSLTLRNSFAQSNGGDGVSASGSNNVFSFTESKLNGGSGMAIGGTGHTLTYNSTSSNGADGLNAPGPGNFDQGGNTGVANAGPIQCRINGVACK